MGGVYGSGLYAKQRKENEMAIIDENGSLGIRVYDIFKRCGIAPRECYKMWDGLSNLDGKIIPQLVKSFVDNTLFELTRKKLEEAESRMEEERNKIRELTLELSKLRSKEEPNPLYNECCSPGSMKENSDDA